MNEGMNERMRKMRTRNQSKKKKDEVDQSRMEDMKGGHDLDRSCSTSKHDSDTLNNVSGKAVGRILKCANSRSSPGVKKKQDRQHHLFESNVMPVDDLQGGENQNVTEVIDSSLVPGSILPQNNVEGATHVSTDWAIPDDKEDTDDSDEWEDGYIPISGSRDSYPDSLPKEIIIEFNGCPSSTKKKSIRRVSAEDKELAELVHKAHLLCLLARGRLVDSACSDPLIQASLLAILPTYMLKIAERPKLTANVLTPIVYWLHNSFHVRSTNTPERAFKLNLASALENHEGTAEEVAALSVALFRALNLTTRFVSILDVAPLKPDGDMLGRPSQDASRVESRIFGSSTLMVARSNQVSACPIQPSLDKTGFLDGTSHRSARQIKENSLTCETDQCKDLPIAAQLSSKMLDPLARKASNDDSKARPTKSAEGLKRKGDLEFELQLEMALAATAAGVHNGSSSSELKDMPSSLPHPPALRSMKRIKIEKSTIFSKGVSTALGSRKVGAPLYWAEVFCSGENLTGKWVHFDVVNAIINGEEKVEAAVAACRKSLRYVIAFAGYGAKDVTRRYCMKWYKIASKRINSPWWDAVLAPLKELESGATGGMVVLEANPESASKELEKFKTLKKCTSKNANVDETAKSSTQESLDQVAVQVSEQHGLKMDVASSSQSSRVATRNSLEDMELQTRALTEPLPTNQQAYKTHHLYAIERWLTKYQILHPKGPVLGFCAGHAVYPRTCVQALQTKQRWLREGLQVKLGEIPAKVVKRSLKVNKAQTAEPGVCEEDEGKETIALFGKWQTEPIDLPHAVNGRVPKNERGQVDVWSEKCLPPGTVHIRLPRLVPVAKRLGVDFAPAMVGFEFRNGRSLPVYEGLVICTEFKDAIMEAYAEEEERREAEEKKRNEIQAISRWYQLLSSIITRDRLNRTYGDDPFSQNPQHLNSNDDVNKPQITNPGDDMLLPQQGQVNVSCSRENLASTSMDADHEHVFPAENQSFDEESCIRIKRCPCGFSVEVEEM